MRLREFPPDLPLSFYDLPVNGGRVISIAVHPEDDNEILVASEFGGIWKTDDGGDTWRHLSTLRALWARDVAYANGGLTIVATLLRDNRVDNGGGIWISRNGGLHWSRPATAAPPANARVPTRISGRGISVSSDGRVVAGTDYGVAVSADGGRSWSHRMVETVSPLAPDLLQNTAFSVLALPGDRVIVTTRTGVYRSDDGGGIWNSIRSGDFRFYDGFKSLDVSPIDSDKVFLLQDYTTLLLYEVESDVWTTIPLPGGRSRGPFIRAARSRGRAARIDLWAGLGASLYKLAGRDLASIKTATATDWVEIGRAQGLHDDAGYLALDAAGYPVLYGSDGGLFRPQNRDATQWERGASAGQGWNSLQIADLGGTNVYDADSRRYRSSLYFATQDNSIWASPDDGVTWPAYSGIEGSHIEVRRDAPADADVTVAYGELGGPLFADANLANPRPVPNLDESGNEIGGMEAAFLTSPGIWMRGRSSPGAVPQLWVSENNGENWYKRAEIALQWQGVPLVSGSPPMAFIPVLGGTPAADGRQRIGFVRIPDLLRRSVRSITEADVEYLPDDGSLGVRGTMWDWQAVLGVHPTDPNLLIAPDINNGVVRVSRDGGATWPTDAGLTDAVTEGGTLLLWDGGPYQMQVMHISFDPYVAGRILVGTREAGIKLSEDGGATWTTVARSHGALYVTGFFFRRDGTIVVSAYGRGLWTLDSRVKDVPFSRRRFCRRPCRYRRGPDPRPARPPSMRKKQVFMVLDGSIVGVRRSRGRVSAVEVTPGSTYRHYAPAGEPIELDVRTATKGKRFADIAGCRAAVESGEKVLALVLEDDGTLVGVFSSTEERSSDEWRDDDLDEHEHADDRSEQRPYLFVTTDLRMAGLPAVGEDGTVHVRGIGFDPDGGQAELRLDESVVLRRLKVRRDGVVLGSFEVDDDLSKGAHVLELVQGAKKARLSARNSFVIAEIDDLEESSASTSRR
jgi:photosystem II stability/assembly factor-like uncharacterized protein